MTFWTIDAPIRGGRMGQYETAEACRAALAEMLDSGDYADVGGGPLAWTVTEWREAGTERVSAAAFLTPADPA